MTMVRKQKAEGDHRRRRTEKSRKKHPRTDRRLLQTDRRPLRCKRKRDHDGLGLAEKAGWSSIYHLLNSWPHRLVGLGHQIFILITGVRIPLGSILFETLAQSVEHLTFNEGVDGSSPSSLKFLSSSFHCTSALISLTQIIFEFMILAKWCKNGATKNKLNQHFIPSLNPSN